MCRREEPILRKNPAAQRPFLNWCQKQYLPGGYEFTEFRTWPNRREKEGTGVLPGSQSRASRLIIPSLVPEEFIVVIRVWHGQRE
jgi:hypothetical protein